MIKQRKLSFHILNYAVDILPTSNYSRKSFLLSFYIILNYKIGLILVSYLSFEWLWLLSFLHNIYKLHESLFESLWVNSLLLSIFLLMQTHVYREKEELHITNGLRSFQCWNTIFCFSTNLKSSDYFVSREICPLYCYCQTNWK